MLTKSQIAVEIEAITGIKPNLVKSVLDGLATVASEQVSSGEDFTIPGIARISWRFRKAMAKGERWKKGQLVQGFGGSEEVKDTDSPAQKAKARLVAAPTGAVGRLKPKTDPASQTSFLKSTAGKTVARNKG